ncbi:MAG TPA: hypothetical protein ENN03_05340 [bacterium]|nr:hypothetical protein [bacterium]
MIQKKPKFPRWSVVWFLLFLLLLQLPASAGEEAGVKDECLKALLKCGGTTLFTAFGGWIPFLVSSTFCLNGYAWCMMYFQ